MENIKTQIQKAIIILNEIVAFIDAKDNFHNLQSSKIFLLNTGQTSDQYKKKEELTLTYNGTKLGKRVDGRWEMKLKTNGKYKSIYGNTQKECISNYKKAKKELSNENIINNKLLFGEWVETWLKNYKTKDIRNTEIMLRMHILPILKDNVLADLKQIDLINVIKQIESSRTAIYVYQILKQIISTAFINELIPKDISISLKKPDYEKQNGRALTYEEQEKFIHDIKGDSLEKYYLFVLYSGTRKSEAYNLLWEDIDFNNETILIRGTKTKGSYRTIPLFKKIKELLEPIKKDNGRVFPTRNSTYITKHIKDFGNFRLHDLRHTFTTNAIEKGVPMKVVQEWLGHSNYSTTADIYTHIRNNANKEFSKLLDN